ncbi:MAG TPA: N-acetylmuramic acid 6-phosphate etherase [Candidatus Dormibacteraeota bacterium]|nr:N-acetylmuramic acid 6-phosphate etherase [Candidatus Dormibacteraeota bacterium]
MENLETERSQGRDDLDLRSTLDLVRLMNEEDATVPAAVGRALPAIARAIDAIAQRLAAGGRLVYVGAGSAGRLGVLDASECGPTYGTPEGQVLGLIAGGPAAVARPAEGAEDDGGAGAADLARLGLSAADAVVGISASGRTPYVLGAVSYAAAQGALTVGIACNAGTPLSRAVGHPIEVETGPEIIAGSTRLKAGTAQKLVLNMLSTVVMVRLGKTYGGLMVDLRATSDKLRDRARRIVAQAGRVDDDRARAALAEAGGQVKVAVLMLRCGLPAAAAAALLDAAGGSLRRALDQCGPPSSNAGAP